MEAAAAVPSLKPDAIIYESEAEAEARAKRQRSTQALLRSVETQPRARFVSATAMLSWFFAMRSHMEGAPAIDPAADVIQGLRVDRDERLYWVGSVKQALEAVVKKQGHSAGALLLWLHLRPREVVGYKRRRGVRVAVFSDSVPLWELFREPAVQAYGLAQRKAIAVFRAALTAVEEYAFERGWLAFRARRERPVTNTWRRG